MTKRKVHLEVITRAANESDPESEGYILCGLDIAEELTFSEKAVTCKKCLSLLRKAGL